MHAATAVASALGAIRPGQRLRTEPTRKLRASGVRRLRHRNHSLTDLQPSARWQTVDRQIEINDELITGQLPPITITRDRCEHPAVHDSDLPERVRAAIGSCGSPGLPAISFKPMDGVEDSFLENPSLINRWSADDHFDRSHIAW